jgi:hypothetical protein
MSMRIEFQSCYALQTRIDKPGPEEQILKSLAIKLAPADSTLSPEAKASLIADDTKKLQGLRQ